MRNRDETVVKYFKLFLHSLHANGREVHTELWWRNLRERGHSVNLGKDGRIILKYVLNK